MLTLATVNKIKCDFVYKLQRYLLQRKYVIDPCATDLKEAYLLLKRATNECLTYEDECEIESMSINDHTVNCDTSTSQGCSTVGEISLTSSPISCTYSTALKNPLTGTGYLYVDVQNNAVYQKGKVNVEVTSHCSSYSNVEEAETGHILVGASVITSPVDWDFYGMIGHILDYVSTFNLSYIKTIRLYRTDTGGNLVNTPIDIDISPTTSPYLSCSGCTTVTASHLYFSHANYVTALTNVIKNAVLTLSGSVSNIDLFVSGIGSPVTGYWIYTRIKHNPAGVHYGVNKNDAQLVWFNQYNNADVTQTQTSNTSNNAGMYFTNTITDLCSPFTTTLPNRWYGLSVNWAASNFNKLVLASPLATNYAIMNAPTSIVCPAYQLTAAVTPTPATMEWTNAADDVLSTGNTALVYDNGTYDFTVTYSDGCTATDSITI